MEGTESTGWILFLAIAVVVVGCGAMFFALRLWRLASASKKWPSATGTILSCEIRVGQSSSGSDNWQTTYTPVVEYEYVADGETLRGKRIKFGGAPKTSDLNKARERASQYPVGAQVNVYYNPNKPTQCTLDQNTSFLGMAFLFMFGVIFVVVGAGMFFLRAIIAGGN